jgi:ADP-ribose pyrophosphatase YjhB (NUDIX family)
VSLNDDLLADGEPEREFNPGIASRLPRKRVGAGALIRDDDGRLMMVETTYKPTLEIPGGLAEDGESPLDACARELREELGIEPAIGSLLVADWVPAHGPWPDGLMLVFDGGILRDFVLQVPDTRRDPATGETLVPPPPCSMCSSDQGRPAAVSAVWQLTADHPSSGLQRGTMGPTADRAPGHPAG